MNNYSSNQLLSDLNWTTAYFSKLGVSPFIITNYIPSWYGNQY